MPSAAQQTVLIVDDRAESRRLARTMVESLGYRAVEAESGAAAVDRIATQVPDLVLLDVVMPGMDGFEVVRRIRSDAPRRIPVVMLTALDDLDTRVKSIEAGADDVLTKPLDASLLGVRLSSLLDHRVRVEKLTANQGAALSLARAVEAKSRYTVGHNARTAHWSAKIGEELGLDAERVAQMYVGAMLHDVGKIGIPDALLNKPAPLTPDEAEVMRTHPIVGDSILKPLQVDPVIEQIARHHHERMDGSGYPDRLKAGDLPVEVRIVSVADAFDALTYDRPYRKATPPSEALPILREAARDGLFDGDLIAVVEHLANQRKLVGSSRR